MLAGTSHLDYDQALAFDQLREQQKENGAFVEFKEGPIKFPPTFKYDVMKGLRRDGHRILRDHMRRRDSHENRKRRSQLSAFNLSEVQEVDSDYVREDADSTVELRERKLRASSVDTYDTRSMVSSTTTTTSSRSHAMLMNGEGILDDDQSVIGDAKKNNALQIVHHEILTRVATKAKDKWLSFVKHRDSKPRMKPNVSRRRARGYSTSTPDFVLARAKYSQAIKSSGEINTRTSSSEAGCSVQNVADSFNKLEQSSSRKSEHSAKDANHKNAGVAEKPADLVENEAGCYDSSNKKRVPSW